MDLGTLILVIGLVALVLTALIVFVLKKHENIVVSFLQNFCGALFIFSGWVKAADPLGTAYKLQDYFKEFESTFQETWFSFISPMFPFFAEYNVAISVIVIVFEIVLGILLIIGAYKKFTARAFFGLVAFFTLLTGFTYLTGYVQEGGNFFTFSTWGPYDANNMKVKDCGCFGDFIKLEPKISFFKDVFLLIPAIIFLFTTDVFHQLFSKSIRRIITILGTIAVFIYCLSNYVWDIPHMDFRPFAKGKNVAEIRMQEEEAQANVEIVAWKLKSRNDGKVVEIPSAQYYKEMTSTYSKKDWEVIEQVKTEPAIKSTKISEFEVTDTEGNDLTYTFLEGDQPLIMLVSYKLKADIKSERITVQDTIIRLDSVLVEDALVVNEKIDTIISKEKSIQKYLWNKGFSEKVKTVSNAARSFVDKGIPVYYVVGGAGPDQIAAFKEDFNLNGVNMCMADDILLKTLVRSNPGTMLWDKGVMVDKWHISKLNPQDILSEYFNK